MYCHAHLGMGLAFHDVKPHFVNVLQNWVMAGAGKKDRGTNQGNLLQPTQFSRRKSPLLDTCELLEHALFVLTPWRAKK